MRWIAGVLAVAVTLPSQQKFRADGASLTNTRAVGAKLGDVISVKDPQGSSPGAVGDGVTDDTAAMTAMAAYVNATTPTAGKAVTVVFPCGTYNYSGGLIFTSPVYLQGNGCATLNYSGSSYAIKMGPDGLTVSTSSYEKHQIYTVDGLTFIGGASMIHGIYFNAFITQPRVQNTGFYNFGGLVSQYSIFFQTQNWDARVFDSWWYATNSAGAHSSFIRANGIASDGTTSDNGNTQLSVTNTLALNLTLNVVPGVGIYTNGAYAKFINDNINGFAPEIWIGAQAGNSSNATRIENVAMENVRGSTPCVMYGEASGTYASFFTQDLVIEDSYCNVHNVDNGSTVHFLGPAGSGSGLQSLRFNNNLALFQTAGQPLVVQNNLVAQFGNQAGGNRQGAGWPDSAPNPLHTAGGNITGWGGSDGEYTIFANSSDAANVFAVRAGKTAQQFNTIQLEDFAGSLMGAYQCSGSGAANNCVLYGPTTSTGLTVPSTGGITIKSVTQANLGTPANGTILYCSDCTTASACTGGGTGALASRQAGAWKCL